MHGARRLGWGCLLVALGGASLAEAQAPDARLARLEQSLREEQEATLRWSRAWVLTFAALTLGQAGAGLWWPDEGLRIDARVGAVKSGLGLLAAWAVPFVPHGAADELDALPSATPAQRQRKLAVAERLLRRAADDERLRSGWLPRLASAAVNLGGAYYLWLAHDRHVSGWLSLPSGLLVGELQIQTQPTGALRAARREGLTTAAQPVPGGALFLVQGSY